MMENNHDPITSSRERSPLASRPKRRFNLFVIAFMGALLLTLESLLLRSQLQMRYFSTFSVLDTLWYIGIIFIAALWFCVLFPKVIQTLFFIFQLFLNLFILGAFFVLQELPSLGAVQFVLHSPNLPKEAFVNALHSPLGAIIILLCLLKLLCAFFSPPFEAKKRLPAGTLLFMACCITFVPAHHATLSVLSTTRSPSYKIMAVASIERHGYFFTWLAEAKSKTWSYCYIPPEQ